jgi:hypothetical protein
MALAGPINDEVPPTQGWSTPQKRLGDTATQAIAVPVLVVLVVLVAGDEIHWSSPRSTPSSSELATVTAIELELFVTSAVERGASRRRGPSVMQERPRSSGRASRSRAPARAP